ncbi:hypothetical protein [Pantoea sp. ME81]|uniref:hypothetical protein n=1 Tax=Pantoea sp. ME81 TaxID=2743935 RepID=UPI0015F70F81|nr:hypothetical protein [Pantoea sp. ME81]
MTQIKRYSVKREGITYGYIENDSFEDSRWRFVHPIEDGKFTMDITSIHPVLGENDNLSIEKRTKSNSFSIDMKKAIITRDDGTVFEIVEEIT